MIRNFVTTFALISASVFWVAGQDLDRSFISSLKKNACNVGVDSEYENGDWGPVLKEIGDKKIVLLGEPNHGSKEIFLSRNDLIKSLHEKAGFNVVLFESGIGELAVVDLERDSLSPQQMTQGFFGGWHTPEFVQLMEYLQSNSLSVGGFDVQRTGNSFNQLLFRVAHGQGIDSTYFSGLEDRYTLVRRLLTSRQAVYDSVSSPTTTLLNDYNKLVSLIEGGEQSSKELLLTRKTLLNRIAFLEYFLQFVKDHNWNRRWKARDSAMASNISWFLETLYKDSRVIIVAHNFHVARSNEKEEVMGEFLKEKYSDEMYSIGVFAGKGSYLGNSGNEQSMEPPDTTQLDIKTVIGQLPGKVNFLPVPKKVDKGSAWLFDKVIINDTFIDLSGTKELVLAEHFDGLLFIDKISPAGGGR